MTTEQERAEFRALVESLPGAEQERTAFEAWARKHGQPVFRDDDEPECYAYSNVQDNWTGWQARAALQSQDRADAERYNTLVASGKFVPATLSPSCLWGLRTSGTKATKAELDEAIDHARRIEGGGNDI